MDPKKGCLSAVVNAFKQTEGFVEIVHKHVVRQLLGDNSFKNLGKEGQIANRAVILQDVMIYKSASLRQV